jgi:hypothetical protein
VSIPLILLLVAPLAGAVFAIAFAEVPSQRRALVLLAGAVSLGGAAYGLQRAVASPPVTWRGFALDPWRALLVCGGMLSALVAASDADGKAPASRSALAQAATLVAAALMVVPLVVTTAHLLAIGLIAGTVGFAGACFASTRAGTSVLHAARAAGALAASDLLALVALGTALSHGAALPPRLSGAAGWLLAAAALIRLGVAPVAGPGADASGAGVAALWRGPARAQGLLLAVMAIGAGRSVAYALAAAGALAVGLAAVAALAGEFDDVIGGIGVGVALAGFAIGGPAATWGGTLAAAAAFAASAASSAPAPMRDFARATLAVAPAGGLIAGAALVSSAAIGAATVRPWFFLLAIPLIAGALASVALVWRGPGERAPRAAPSAALAGALGIAVALALAALPGRAATGLGVPVAASVGTGRLLSPGGETGVAHELAILAIAAAALAFAAGPGRLGSGGAPGVRGAPGASRRDRGSPYAFRWWASAPDEPNPKSALASGLAASRARRYAIAAIVLFAASLGLALRIFVVASGRGFL